MTRALSNDYKTAIQSRIVNTTFLLIDINFSTPVYYTTLSKQITWNGNVYTPSAGIIEIGTPTESLDYVVGTINLTMSGSNQSNISLALSEDYLHKQLIIRRAVLDANNAIIADPLIIYDGRLNSYVLNYSPLQGTNRIEWEVTSHWADFNRRRGRHSNNESQQALYPTDLGFEFAAYAVNDIKWGQA